jgi:hypothetical protein
VNVLADCWSAAIATPIAVRAAFWITESERSPLNPRPGKWSMSRASTPRVSLLSATA